jgi:signal transduction histidine kinase
MSKSRISAGVVVIVAALGIVAELVSDAGPGPAAADLATGWVLLGCGMWGGRQRPREMRWSLLVLASAAWFAGTFAATLVYLHRGPLVHALAGGSPARASLRVTVVVAGYVTALVTGSLDGPVTVATAVLVAAVAAASWRSRGASSTGAHRLEVGALIALSGALALAGLTALAQVSSSGADVTLYAYELALGASALMLAAVPGSESRARARLADLVVELGAERGSPTVRGALAGALGDPSLQVGYRLPGAEGYVDLGGRPVELPSDGSLRAVTIVEHGGEPVAAVVHDAAILDDPALAEAVQEAATLVLANAALEAVVGTQLGELRASRRRIVEARDEQRRRLSQQLHDGAVRRLGEVAAAVARARTQAGTSAESHELLDLVDSELRLAREELVALARGIHPPTLTERGLSAALSALAERAPVPVDLVAPAQRLPARIEAAAYFVCAEALTNVTKYACASRVRCEVTLRAGSLLVVVADDGVGGADPARGSGLRGLADRVEALGGRFAMTSPPGEGTSLRVELRLDRGSQGAA